MKCPNVLAPESDLSDGKNFTSESHMRIKAIVTRWLPEF